MSTTPSDNTSPPLPSTATNSPSESRPREDQFQDVQNAFANEPQPSATAETATTSSKYPAFQYNTSLHPIDTAPGVPTFVTHKASPLSAELRPQTDIWPPTQQQKGPSPLAAASHTHSGATAPRPIPSSSPDGSSGVKSLSASQYSGSGLSPGSAASSPGLGPISDMTPLPSPIGISPSPWSRMPALGYGSPSPTLQSQGSPTSLFPNSSPPRKRKEQLDALPPPVLQPPSLSSVAGHNRNRSLSDYVPPGASHRGRNIAVSGSQTPTSTGPQAKPMQREEYLAVQRGISSFPTPRPPTPPPSNRSMTGSSDSSSPPRSPQHASSLDSSYEATMLSTGKTRRWHRVRQLGTGTFSNVMLATSDPSAYRKREDQIDRKSLVAVKVCEHGPAGGADEKRIESSLKRELEILKLINHPSLVRLKAVNISEKRAYLVMNYCPGGDMFDVADHGLSLLTPSLVQRIFAELVAAVRYLHSLHIVHRDIKLESR